MKSALALAAALLAALAVLLILLAGHTDERHAEAPPLVLGAPAGPAIKIGPGVVGLSIEYQLLARELGASRCPPIALLRAIKGLGSPAIRIGGDSQDETAPSGTPPHPGVSDLPVGFWARLGCLERETSVPVVVGLNLASGEPAWAATVAADARAVIPPSRLRFELGNEPDIYGGHVPWWNGTRLVHGPMPFPTYLARARELAAAIGRGSQIEGPDFASGRWIKELPALAHALGFSAFDAHYYPLDACRSDAGDSAAALLSRDIQVKLNERVRIAREAHAAGLPALISETNSISCGGVAGISDSPAAAVWAVRLLLTALRDGFGSVRFHASGGAYDPFVIDGAALTTRPIYLGLQLASEVLAPGAALRAIPSARALAGVAVSAKTSTTYILSNYTAAALAVALPAGRGVRAAAVRARAPTLRQWNPRSGAGRVRVSLPPNSVVAITAPAPG